LNHITLNKDGSVGKLGCLTLIGFETLSYIMSIHCD
jgi:hypothetical protein